MRPLKQGIVSVHLAKKYAYTGILLPLKTLSCNCLFIYLLKSISNITYYVSIFLSAWPTAQNIVDAQRTLYKKWMTE